MPHLFTLSHTLRPLRRLGRRGFSLIEVLVAMTILTVIVLIVAGIFQQTGLAWTLGLRRADAQSVTRAVVGAISRDLAMMVDPANFVIAPAEQDGSARESAYSAGNVDAADGALSGSLDFWILRPADLSMTDMADSSLPTRELVHLTYSSGSNVTRKEEIFAGDPPRLKQQRDTRFNLGRGSISFTEPSGTNYAGFASLYDQAGIEIKVKPHTPETINDYEIAVASCGPDGEWGTEDDIRPWVEGEDNK